MKCKCPACARTTQVPPDMLDFLSRCDRCGSLLRPRMSNSGIQGKPEKIVAHVVISGRYREDPCNTRASILDVLTPAPRPLSSTSALARAAPSQSVPAVLKNSIQDVLRNLAEAVASATTNTALQLSNASARFHTARRALKKSPPPAAPSNPACALESLFPPPTPTLPVIEPKDPLEGLSLQAADFNYRRRALRRAQLRTSHHTLGWIGTCGFTFILLLAGFAVILKSTGLFGTPRHSHAGIFTAPPPSTSQPTSQPSDLFPDAH